MTYTAKQLRRAWLDAALAEWRRGIRDTQPYYDGDREVIAELYRRIGWDWEVSDGYDETEGHWWCGVGLAAAGLRVGDHLEDDRCVPVSLHPGLAEYVIPSTSRLASHEISGATDWYGPEYADCEPPERVAPEKAGAGDVLTVHPDKKVYGSHIAMAEGPPDEAQYIQTTEANAVGRMPDAGFPPRRPDGEQWEGWCRRKRHLDEVARVWRFGDPHFVTLEED